MVNPEVVSLRGRMRWSDLNASSLRPFVMSHRGDSMQKGTVQTRSRGGTSYISGVELKLTCIAVGMIHPIFCTSVRKAYDMTAPHMDPTWTNTCTLPAKNPLSPAGASSAS